MKDKKERLKAMLRDGQATCHKMADDILERLALERIFPSNFKQVRYEDLATQPEQTARNIYDFLQLELPAKVLEWLKANTRAKAVDQNNKLKTSSTNSAKTAFTWQKNALVPRKALAHICRFVLNQLNYDD